MLPTNAQIGNETYGVQFKSEIKPGEIINKEVVDRTKFFDGNVVNVSDDGMGDWKTVIPHSARHLALTRTTSDPIRIKPIRHHKLLEKTRSSNPVSNRITYDRDALLSYRYSPHSMTPPSDLEQILEATKPAKRQRPRKKKLESTLSGISNCSMSSTVSDMDIKATSDSEEGSIGQNN